jgi:hypothetical protein
VRLAPGTYIVTIVHDERGAPDDARLLRVNVEGEPPDPVDPFNTGCLTKPDFRAAVKVGAGPSPDQ